MVFRPLVGRRIQEVIPGYHPLYAATPAEVVVFIDDHFAHGNFRNWASFTASAQDLCLRSGRTSVDEAVARNVFALQGGGGDVR